MSCSPVFRPYHPLPSQTGCCFSPPSQRWQWGAGRGGMNLLWGTALQIGPVTQHPREGSPHPWDSQMHVSQPHGSPARWTCVAAIFYLRTRTRPPKSSLAPGERWVTRTLSGPGTTTWHAHR